jgi:hypothetical protein
MKAITLTTDFGTRDWFAGAMKGVILGIAPRANVIDLTHEIPPGDVRAGAFALMAAARPFPRGTIHVTVVDPGVGSERAAIAVRTGNFTFVGPDNGVLSLALAREKIQSVRRLENKKYFLPTVSATFHGRDVFAPVAAHLSRGVALKELGPEADNFVRLDWPAARRAGLKVRGEVVYLDRFGNAITNIATELLAGQGGGKKEVLFRRRLLCPLAEFYQAAPVGLPVAVIGSSGFLEIAINGGNAAKQLRLKVGETVELR